MKLSDRIQITGDDEQQLTPDEVRAILEDRAHKLARMPAERRINAWKRPIQVGLSDDHAVEIRSELHRAIEQPVIQ